MDSFDWNRLAAAVVLSCLAFTSAWGVGRIIIPEGSSIRSFSALETTENKLDLSSANIEKGSAIAAQQCGTCHTFKQNEPNKIGPTLYAIKNRPIASLPNFNYSDSLKSYRNEQWTAEKMNIWLHKPMEVAPATLMAYAGLNSEQDRKDVIAYLETLTPSTSAIPKNKQPASSQSLSQNAIQNGKDVFQKNCSVCHTVNAKGAKLLGPNLYDIVNKPIASETDYNYSKALKNKHGNWNENNLDQWMENPQQWAPGNKMVYPGVSSLQARRDIIVYLRSLSQKPGQE